MRVWLISECIREHIPACEVIKFERIADRMRAEMLAEGLSKDEMIAVELNVMQQYVSPDFTKYRKARLKQVTPVGEVKRGELFESA